ncbi:MAG: hypothetical protein HY303_14325, partial [Candidatus Wallbacteria bacterium]|nr:hypothetical protein [Candidatus Wallbacteria bacterium]
MHGAREIRRRSAYSLVEVLVGAVLGVLLLAGLYWAMTFFARMNARTGDEAGASLELTELLEHLCQDLREADDLTFEEVQGLQSLRLKRLAGVEETGATETEYSISEAGKGVERRGAGGRKRRYDFRKAGGENDPLLVELSPDRRTLYVRGLGMRLQMPTPMGRNAGSTASGEPDATATAGTMSSGTTGAGATGSGPAAGAGGDSDDAISFVFAPAPSQDPTAKNGDAAEGSGDTNGLAAGAVNGSSGAAADGQEPIAIAGTPLPMEGDAHVPALVYQHSGGGDEIPAAGTDPTAPGFGIYETRSNVRDPATGRPIVFLRGNRGGKAPPEP